MLEIPKGLARAFRAMARKCVPGRPRGPAPPVRLESDGERLTLSTTLEGITLRLDVPTVAASARSIVVPMELLDAVEGFAVEITATGSRGVARWEGREGRTEWPFEVSRKEVGFEPTPRPKSMQAMPPALLNVLHECWRTAAREASRYAIHRVKLDGKGGTVTGTDGRQALVWSGFTFPFPEAVLLPAVPAFGSKELAATTEVRIGREGNRFVLQAGGWTLILPIDTEGRYPDVSSVIPRDREGSVVGIEECDATEVLRALGDWPVAADGSSAVTIDVDRGVTVRCRETDTDRVREFRLLRSTWTGPSVRVAVVRQALVRALALGCLTLRLIPRKPMVAEGPNRTFVVVTLDDSAVVPATASRKPLLPVPTPSVERSMVPRKSPEFHGPPARPEPAATASEWIDPLAEAEALRAALMEAATRASRLVQCLKTFRRQRRVLESAWTSLKSIGMGPGGGA